MGIAGSVISENAEILLSELIRHVDILTVVYYPQEHRYECINCPEIFGNIPQKSDDFPNCIFKYLNLSPEHSRVFRDAVRAIDNGEDSAECTVEIKPEDEGIWISLKWISFKDDDGVPGYAVCIGNDVTGEKEKELRFAKLVMDRENLQGKIIAASCFNVTKDRTIRHSLGNGAGSPVPMEFIPDEIRESILRADPRAGHQNDETKKVLFSSASQIPDDEERESFVRMCSIEGMRDAFREGKTDRSMEYKRLLNDRMAWVSTRVILVTNPDSHDIYAFYYTREITDKKQDEMIINSVMHESCDFIALINTATDKAHFIYISDLMKRMAPRWTAPGGVRYGKELEITMKEHLSPEYNLKLKYLTSIDYIAKQLINNPSFTATYDLMEKGKHAYKQVLYRWLDETHTNIIAIQQDVTQTVTERMERDKITKDLQFDNRILEQAALEANEFVAVINTLEDTIELKYGTWYAKGIETPPEQRKLKREVLFKIISDNFLGSQADRDSFQKNFNRAGINKELDIKGEAVFVMDFPMPGKRTQRKQFRITGLDPARRYLLIVKTDITKSYEEDMHLRDALDAAKQGSRAKTEFLSHMSHDIRTPMNAILGFSELLLRDADDPEKVKEEAEKIIKSGNHLLGLINDVLDMSKIESGKAQLSKVKFRLEDTVSLVDGMIRPLTEAKGQTFDVTFTDVRHKTFVADDNRLQQVLINTLSNAHKYTGEGGHITMKIKGNYEDDKLYETVLFEITDNGIGMSEEYQRMLFEPFSRERQAGTDKTQGTGLGMAITHNILTRMGGTISVKSELGKGSTFIIAVPLQIADDPEERLIDAANRAKDTEEFRDDIFKGLRILVVEDNDLNAEIICEILSIQGAEVTLAGDGSIALETFKTSDPGSYDLILMDIQMPVMNGYESARAIRAISHYEFMPVKRRNEAAQIPIIAMTANAFSEDVQNALASGMNGHVAKPLNMEVLKKTVSRVMKQRRE
ncbi:MAG: response regulator [Lachnospiraceae bacterium]|nr:response regulator [Lachnospiraceae bacterium]